MAGVLWEIGQKEILEKLEDVNPIQSFVKASGDEANSLINKGLHKLPIVGDLMDGVNAVTDKGKEIIKKGLDDTGITDLKNEVGKQIDTGEDKLGEKIRDKLGIPKDEPDLHGAMNDKLKKSGWSDTPEQQKLRQEIVMRKVSLQNISDHFNALRESGRFREEGGEAIQDRLIQDFKDIESGKKSSADAPVPLHELEFSHDVEFTKGMKRSNDTIMKNIKTNVDAGKTQAIDPIDKAFLRRRLKEIVNVSDEAGKDDLINMLDNEDPTAKNVFKIRDDGSIFINESAGNVGGGTSTRAEELTILIKINYLFNQDLKNILLGADKKIISTTDAAVNGTPFIIDENKEFSDMRDLIKKDLANQDFSGSSPSIDAQGRIDEFHQRHDKKLWDTDPDPEEQTEQDILDAIKESDPATTGVRQGLKKRVVLQKGGDPSTPEVRASTGGTTTTEVRQRLKKRVVEPEKASPTLSKQIEIPDNIKLKESGRQKLQNDLNNIESKLGKEHAEAYLKLDFTNEGNVRRQLKGQLKTLPDNIRKMATESRKLLNADKKVFIEASKGKGVDTGAGVGGDFDIDQPVEGETEAQKQVRTQPVPKRKIPLTVDTAPAIQRNIPEGVLINDEASIGSVLSDDPQLKESLKGVSLKDFIKDGDLMSEEEAREVWKIDKVEDETNVKFSTGLYNKIKNNMIASGKAAGEAVVKKGTEALTAGGTAAIGIAGSAGTLFAIAQARKLLNNSPHLSEDTKAIGNTILDQFGATVQKMKDEQVNQILGKIKDLGKTDKELEQQIKNRDNALNRVNSPPRGSSSSVKASDRRDLRDAESGVIGAKQSIKTQLDRLKKDMSTAEREIKKDEATKREIASAKKDKDKQKEEALKNGIVSPKMTPFNINFTVDNQSDSSVNKKFSPINNTITGKKNKIVNKKFVK